MTATRRNVFDVDLDGLGKLLERRGLEWLVYELVQNAWDTGTREVDLRIEPVPGRPFVDVNIVDDHPEGFADLSHAWTLFAESSRKLNPEQRGRFNLGEKLVLAYALAHGGEVEIVTTTGSVRFDRDRGRTKSRKARACGSEINARVRATRAQMDEMIAAAGRLIPPPGAFTTVNGERLKTPEFIGLKSGVLLPTVVADEAGVLRRAERRTSVRFYKPRPGEKAAIYEMGIPIVETGDAFHADVGQKVPLNMDRDNVTPAYLRAVRALVLNAAADLLTEEEAAEGWVADALGHAAIEETAVLDVLDKRFGEKRAIVDPSDREAGHRLVSEGYRIMHGPSLPKRAWETVRRFQAARPAGQISPSAKPYAEDGTPERVIPESEWSANQRRIATFAVAAGCVALGFEVSVRIVREPTVAWIANYGNGRLCLNAPKLGASFFEDRSPSGLTRVLALLVHEYGHKWSPNHLDTAYHDGLCMAGARIATSMARGKFDPSGHGFRFE